MESRLIAIALLSMLAATPAHAAPPLGDSAACAPGAATPGLLVRFDGLKDRRGRLRVELFPGNDQDFLKDDVILAKEGKDFRRVEIATPQAGPVAICIRVPRPGRFSFAIIHDRDGKRKFSLTSDGIAFPGNPKLGWGRPKSSKAALTLGGGATEIQVRMNYFNGLGFSPLKKD